VALCLSVALTTAIGHQYELAIHNLSGLALNLLEMIYTHWLDVIRTSCLKHLQVDSVTRQQFSFGQNEKFSSVSEPSKILTSSLFVGQTYTCTRQHAGLAGISYTWLF
jgi:uncharacterized GH25 family protein